RLDAWVTALFAQRLDAQRASAPPNEERRTGIYIGAFGWVEPVKRTSRMPLRREDLPGALRPADDAPVFEEDDVPGPPRALPGSRRGGYTRAPSLSHAAPAALLPTPHFTSP